MRCIATSTQLRAYFDAGQEVETRGTQASNAVNKTVVVMTVATGKHKGSFAGHC